MVTSSVWSVQLSGGLNTLALLAEERKSSAVALGWRVVLPIGLCLHVAQLASLVPNNQAQYCRDAHHGSPAERYVSTNRRLDAFAQQPNERQQLTDSMILARSVCESVRVLEGQQHAN